MKTVSPSDRQTRPRDGERGFTLLQMVVALAIVSIVTTVAVFGIRSARAAMRLSSSSRTFAQAAERARLDAIRRRTTSFVEFTGPNTYEITMDFLGTGTGITRSFTLDSGVVVTDDAGNTLAAGSDALPYALFDWRGRTAECSMLFRLKNEQGDQTVVQIAGSGDITVNNSVTTLPTITYSNVNSTSDVNPSAALTGNDNKLNLTPCGSTTTSGGGGTTTGGGSTTVTCAAGTLSASTTYISDLKRSGGNSRTVTITATAPGTVTYSADPNLTLTAGGATTFTSSSGGSVTYTVKSNNKSIGNNFSIKFSFSNCSPVSVTVKVTK